MRCSSMNYSKVILFNSSLCDGKHMSSPDWQYTVHATVYCMEVACVLPVLYTSDGEAIAYAYKGFGSRACVPVNTQCAM